MPKFERLLFQQDSRDNTQGTTASKDDKKYGFRYFDKPQGPDKDEEELEESDEFDLHSCAKNCCDPDCECDDCVRCSTMGVEGFEDADVVAAA